MSESEVEWVGTSCGKHGSYTFYKGFKLTVSGQTKKYLLGEFYFVRNSKDRPICIAELQLVWHDANTGNQLASARLYFRPEATPGGRQNTHGKDELLYTDEKVVIKCRDMLGLECDGAEWCYGLKAISETHLQAVKQPSANGEVAKYRLCKNTSKEKNEKTATNRRAEIVILSFPAYCRYQSLLKKLSNGLVLSKMEIVAFGGIVKSNDSTWISFSRCSFHHPELDKFDFFNDNKAPVLKGRPRKKRSDKAIPSKGSGRGKYRRNVYGVLRDNIVGRRPSTLSESSDENQTDTSEESSLGVHELPCPPKLVSAVKEEKPVLKEVNQSVLCSAKQSPLVDQSSFVDDMLPDIPPIPKLVKIEPEEAVATTTTYECFRQPVVEARESVLGPAPLSVSRVEKLLMPKLQASCTKASVISSTFVVAADGTHRRPVYRPIKMRPQEHATTESLETQSREAQTRVSSGITDVAPSLTNQMPVTVPETTKPTLVSHAGTITVNRTNIQPRMSAIVCTTQGAGARSLVETASSKLDAERSSENLHNDLRQTFKRKRGRPPGKSLKYMKVQDVTSENRAMTPLQQLEVNVSETYVKSEPATSPTIDRMMLESKSSPELEDADERKFMTILKNFMKKRGSPIEKIPALGFRKINLFKMFEVTRALGGYDEVTAKRLWRRVYNEVGGAPSITSAATNSRKHYERLLLPYERFMKGQDPLMMVEKPDTAPVAEKIVATERDQNANVVLQKEPVIIVKSEPAIPSKPAVSISEHHVLYTSSTAKPAVEFVTSGSRGSPVMLYSSTVDQLARRRDVVSPQDVTRTSPIVRYESMPNVITSVGDCERFTSDLKSDTARENCQMKPAAYITEIVDEDMPTAVCVSQKSRTKNDARTSVATDVEREHEYPPSRYDIVGHVNESFRLPRAQEERYATSYYSHARNKISTPAEITHEPRDRNKAARDPGDGVLMMNVRMADGKSRSASGRSQRQRVDDAFMSTFSVPVFQPSHFPHSVELYDLPNGGFPLRTSSRIFMPSSHQLFPSSALPIGTMSQYQPHILTSIGPEPGAVYQLPIPAFYPELSYPLDTCVSILRS